MLQKIFILINPVVYWNAIRLKMKAGSDQFPALLKLNRRYNENGAANFISTNLGCPG